MHDLKAEALHMKEALFIGNLDAFAAAMRVSWEAKKKMANRISNQNIDEIYETALKEGGRAGKVSGAGGGGFMMFVVDPVKRAGVIRCLRKFSGSISTCKFVEQGAHSWTVM